jgi:uncharacterized protein with HEPN domain
MSRDNKSPELYLKDILESINILQGYIQGMTWQDFDSDVGLQDKVIRRMEVIGEAAKYISEELRERTPDIPWTLITDLRNVLIHEYFGINLHRLWDVASGPKLKELKKNVEKLLEKL